MIETKFKQTEIGPIPEDWEVSSLSDVGEIKMCKRILKFQTSNKGDIPFYKIGTFGKVADAYIPRELFEEYLQKYNYPKKGDILLSAAGTIGRTVVFDGKPSYFQDSNIVWINNDESLILNSLLYYIYDRVSWVTESGTIPRIYNGIVHSIKFAHPTSIVEQEKIAKALSDVDVLISDLDALIAKKRDIKQGAMQQLLTGKTRLGEYSESWKCKKIGEIGVTYSGLTGKTKEDFGGGNAKYVTFLNVLNNPILNPSMFEEVVTKDGEHQNTCHKGDLFFNTSSETPEEVGVCSMLDEEVESLYLNSFCFGFRLTDPNIAPKYLAYYFRSNEGRKLMTVLAQGVTRYNLSKSTFNNAQIMMPPSLAEQEEIAKFFESIDREIAAIELKKAKYESIKQGMKQELLTGKIRLV